MPTDMPRSQGARLGSCELPVGLPLQELEELDARGVARANSATEELSGRRKSSGHCCQGLP